LTKAAAIFLESLRADLRPHSGTQVDMYASTGLVGRDASELWGSNQVALSVAIASLAQDLLIYGRRYNVRCMSWSRRVPASRPGPPPIRS